MRDASHDSLKYNHIMPTTEACRAPSPPAYRHRPASGAHCRDPALSAQRTWSRIMHFWTKPIRLIPAYHRYPPVAGLFGAHHYQEPHHRVCGIFCVRRRMERRREGRHHRRAEPVKYVHCHVQLWGLIRLVCHTYGSYPYYKCTLFRDFVLFIKFFKPFYT